MNKDQLDNLPNYVRKAFHPDFIFLIQPELIQHFPARNWQKAQYFQALNEHLGTEYTLDSWNGLAIAIAKKRDCIAIIPKFTHL